MEPQEMAAVKREVRLEARWVVVLLGAVVPGVARTEAAGKVVVAVEEEEKAEAGLGVGAMEGLEAAVGV